MQNAKSLRVEAVLTRSGSVPLIGSGKFIGQIFSTKAFRGPIPVATNPTPPREDGVIRIVA